MKTAAWFLSFVLLVLAGRTAFAAAPSETPEQRARPAQSADALFPASGRFTASFASGLPFVGAGEVAYGFGDRFALGAMVGATPNVGGVEGTIGVGLRPRVVVFQSGAWRSVAVVPVLYYPQVQGFGGRMDPWALAQPTLTLERALGADATVHVGAGALAAGCMETILSLGKNPDPMFGVWNTATVGGSLRLSQRTVLFGEAGAVLHGVQPAQDWMGGPVIAYAGVSYQL